MTITKELIISSNAWPFQEAKNLLKRFKNGTPEKGYVLFETGYGPSGLPHLGTFGEVARTTMVMHAFQKISDIPTKLICFSDDLDGLRKAPSNVPNQEMLQKHLGQPLTKVPDPFGTHPSFGDHNNARLQSFLNQFGFEYEFYSATDCYNSGKFDDTLLKILKNYERVINVILPTLGKERRATYSPFLPICPISGEVLQVPVNIVDVDKGLISFTNSSGAEHTTSITGGSVKCQWKVDWAMRWDALEVDYEMSGKDLSESVKLSSIIRRILGGKPPEGFTYELFLDDNGEKISKSKGNGITIEEWLRYASPESLSLYMFQTPKRAKKLHFEVIPKAVDEYLTHLSKYSDASGEEKLKNPVYHIHNSSPPKADMPVSFALLLNLVSATNTADKSILWGFLSQYNKGANEIKNPTLSKLLNYAISYYEDFVAPTKSYRLPNKVETAALKHLSESLKKLTKDSLQDEIQTAVFAAGKSQNYENLRDWFKALYQILLGQSQGPRMGRFIALYGCEETILLIERVLRGETLG
ncbi:MAG: lysine--tRNA ligase [Sphingomonadales bacterium]